MRRNKTIVVGIIAIILAIAVYVIASHLQKDIYMVGSENINNGQPHPDNQDSFEPKFVPEGWKVYTNTNLEKGRIAFAYPADWQLIDNTGSQKKQGEAEHITVTGDGYTLKIGSSGRGVPPNLKLDPKPYIIDEVTTRTWQAEVGGGYKQLIYPIDTGFAISVDTPDLSKKISDEIISTISF